MRTKIYNYSSRPTELTIESPEEITEQIKLVVSPGNRPAPNTTLIPFIPKLIDNPINFSCILYGEHLFGSIPDSRPNLENLIGLYSNDVAIGGAALLILPLVRDVAQNRSFYNYYFFANLPPGGLSSTTADFIRLLFTTSAALPATAKAPVAEEFHIVIMINNNDIIHSDVNDNTVEKRVAALVNAIENAFDEPVEGDSSDGKSVSGDSKSGETKTLDFFIWDTAWNTFAVVLQNNESIPVGSFGHLSLSNTLSALNKVRTTYAYTSRQLELTISSAIKVKKQDKLYVWPDKQLISNTGQIPFIPEQIDNITHFVRIERGQFLFGPLPDPRPNLENLIGAYTDEVAPGDAALLILPLKGTPDHKYFYNSYFFAHLPSSQLSDTVVEVLKGYVDPTANKIRIVCMLNNNLGNDPKGDAAKALINALVNAVTAALDAPGRTLDFFVWDTAWNTFAIVLNSVENVPIGSFGHLANTSATHQNITLALSPDESNDLDLGYEEEPIGSTPDERLVRGFGYPVATKEMGIRYIPTFTDLSTHRVRQMGWNVVMSEQSVIEDIRIYQSVRPVFFQQSPERYLSGDLNFIMTVTRPFQVAAGFPFVLPGRRNNAIAQWDVKKGIAVFIFFKNDAGYNHNVVNALLAYNEQSKSVSEFKAEIDFNISRYSKQVLIICDKDHTDYLEKVRDEVIHCLGANLPGTKVFCWITSSQIESRIQVTMTADKVEFGFNPDYWSNCILNFGQQNQRYTTYTIPGNAVNMGLITYNQQLSGRLFPTASGHREIYRKIKQEADKELGLYSMTTNFGSQLFMVERTLSALLDKESILVIIVQRPAFNTMSGHRIFIYHTTPDRMFKSSNVQKAIQRAVKVRELCQVLLVKLQSGNQANDNQVLTHVFNSMNQILPAQKQIAITNTMLCFTADPCFSMGMSRTHSGALDVGIGSPTHDIYFGNLEKFEESTECVIQ